MAIDEAGHDEPHRCVDGLAALEFPAEVGGLADGDDAVPRIATAPSVTMCRSRVEREQRAMLDQDIDDF